MNIKKQNITIEQLKVFCDEYDKLRGKYPESYFEGEAVFEFICKRLNIII